MDRVRENMGNEGAGPLLDKFSRRRAIYMLDFMNAALHGGFALLILSGKFHYGFLIVGCVLLGTIDSVYEVAYNSFYPTLVSEGNYTKAYSIQSTLQSLTSFMVLVSALLYNLVGIAPLFLANMVCLFVAAVMETQIKKEEAYVKRKEEAFGLAQYKKTFREGIDYLKSERGLLAVTLYFSVSIFAGGAFSTIVLPYFVGARSTQRVYGAQLCGCNRADRRQQEVCEGAL
ncbi:MAG: MFS transporter [Roseburia sp.]